MSLKIDHLIPVVVIGLLAFLFIFNNKTPQYTQDGNVIIQPKHITDLFRTTSKSNDHSATITHLESKDKLNVLIVDNQIALPDGETKLPVKVGLDGKPHAIWNVEPVQRDIIFDYDSWGFGAYTGFMDGNFENSKIKNFDVGIRFSPLKIYNTFAIDFLASSQADGLGVSFYPMPLRFGDIWHGMGLGYGRVIDYDIKEQHNLFYLSYATNF